jgi:diacylglycerol kinase
MTWAVHGLHAKTLMLNLEQIDVILVVLIVTGSLPELKVEHIGSDNLVISTDAILISDQVNEFVVDLSSVRIPESATRRKDMMSEEILMLANNTVISFCRFFNESNVIIKLFL